MREVILLNNNQTNCFHIAKQALEEMNYLVDEYEYDVTGNFCNSSIIDEKKETYQEFGILDPKVRLIFRRLKESKSL